VSLGTQVEMTIDGTQSATQAPGLLSMWSDIVTTLREIPGPALGGEIRVQDWVQSKRGRASPRSVGGGQSEQSMPQQVTSHNNLNLNMSPEKIDSIYDMRGHGQIPETGGRASSTRGKGRAGGRGTWRVKRPPLLQPRYFTKATS
jgi:hypothetical protein